MPNEHTPAEWEQHHQASPTGCSSQCDGCHTFENCMPGTHRVGDLLLCGGCTAARRAGATLSELREALHQVDAA